MYVKLHTSTYYHEVKSSSDLFTFTMCGLIIDNRGASLVGGPIVGSVCTPCFYSTYDWPRKDNE